MSEDKSTETALLSCVGVLAGLPLLLASASIIEGLVLVVLWHWFLQPLGLPDLTVPVAIGISCIVALLAHQTAAPTKCAKGDLASQMGHLFGGIVTRPLFQLAIGWVAHLFVHGAA